LIHIVPWNHNEAEALSCIVYNKMSIFQAIFQNVNRNQWLNVNRKFVTVFHSSDTRSVAPLLSSASTNCQPLLTWWTYGYWWWYAAIVWRVVEICWHWCSLYNVCNNIHFETICWATGRQCRDFSRGVAWASLGTFSTMHARDLHPLELCHISVRHLIIHCGRVANALAYNARGERLAPHFIEISDITFSNRNSLQHRGTWNGLWHFSNCKVSRQNKRLSNEGCFQNHYTNAIIIINIYWVTAVKVSCSDTASECSWKQPTNVTQRPDVMVAGYADGTDMRFER